MRLMVTTQDGNVFPIDVAEDMNLEDFFALCRHESDYLKRLFNTNASLSTASSLPNGLTSAAVTTLSIFFEGKSFSDLKMTLKEAGLKADDLLMVKAIKNSQNVAGQQKDVAKNPFANLDFSTIRPSQFGGNRPAATSANPSIPPLVVPTITDRQIRDLYEKIAQNPQSLAMLRRNEPELANEIDKKDYDRFAAIIKWQAEQQKKVFEDRAKILANPLSAEAQSLLMENINREQIDEHMQIALEHTPESFASVHMLYIKCKINGHDIKAFVDSGAQTTIMSESCARQCNVTRLVDRRFAGMAKGVGTSKIIGRIHVAQMQIENDYLATSCTIIENQNVDLLLGLDMMKRHQCCIDLKRNVFVVGTTDTATPFLPESELPPDFESATPTKLLDGAKNADRVRQEDVEKLVQMGFDPKEATEALKTAGGDLDRAAAILLGRGAGSPFGAR